MNHKCEKKGDMGRKQVGRTPLSERMERFLDIPTDLLLGGCYLEMRGRNELKLQGCRRIAVYTEDRIVLKLRRSAVCIIGKHLCCSSYHGGCAVIEGWIKEIDFTDEEESS